MNYVIKGHGAMRYVNTRLHRATEVDDCAIECAKARFEAETNAPDLYSVPREKKVPRVSDGERVAGVLLAVSIGLVGACALVAWWTT